MAKASARSGAQGVLYYDPNETTAKLATATLRLAGFEVHHATTKDGAVELYDQFGAPGEGALVAMLLDASADPKISASVLAAVAQRPGADQLPGILLVSRKNTKPIPAAQALPTIRRPFSSPALLKVVQETLRGHGAPLPQTGPVVKTGEREAQLAALLTKHLGDVSEGQVATLLAELDANESLPSPAGDEALDGSLASLKLEAILEMLAQAGATGVLTVEAEERRGRLHLDKGRVRLAEYRGGDEDLKLGRFVVEGGFMQSEELEAFVVGRDPEGRPLGQRLVADGFLSASDLASVLVAQAREVTCHLLTLGEGRMSFRPTSELHPLAQTASEPGGPELLVAEALLDGLRRLDETAVMGPHMPDVEEVFIRLDEQVARLGRETFARDELGVLELINGRNSVKDVARKTRTGTFSVARILYRLAKSNIVRRRVTPVTV